MRRRPGWALLIEGFRNPPRIPGAYQLGDQERLDRLRAQIAGTMTIAQSEQATRLDVVCAAVFLGDLAHQLVGEVEMLTPPAERGEKVKDGGRTGAKRRKGERLSHPEIHKLAKEYRRAHPRASVKAVATAIRSKCGLGVRQIERVLRPAKK